MIQWCLTGQWTLEKILKQRRKRRSSNHRISGSADTKCKLSTGFWGKWCFDWQYSTNKWAVDVLERERNKVLGEWKQSGKNGFESFLSYLQIVFKFVSIVALLRCNCLFRFLELKLRTSGCQGLYLTISTRDFRHSSKGFVKLAYSLTSNFPKATRVINEADVFDREGSGWGYEEFFPLSWTEFKDQLKRTPLIITSQVSLLEQCRI